MLLWYPQLLHSFEAPEPQASILLYLVFLYICSPPPFLCFQLIKCLNLIKLIKCFNRTLLNLCHSPSNKL